MKQRVASKNSVKFLREETMDVTEDIENMEIESSESSTKKKEN